MGAVVQLQKIGIVCARILPHKLADKIAALIGLLFCYFARTKRAYIDNNVRHMFPGEAITPELRTRYVKGTFKNFARMMYDFFRLSFITKDDFIREVKPVGIDNCAKALELKRGCVLLTLHLGNWDYAGAYLAAIGVPMSALVEETESEMFALYTRHREITGMKTFPVARSAYAFVDTIRNNRVLAVLADRDITKHGIIVDFFSGKRSIPRGLADIIIKKKIPVLFACMTFIADFHRYCGYIEPPLVFEGTSDELNRLMVRKFEGFIRQYPDQWFVFHPEWLE